MGQRSLRHVEVAETVRLEGAAELLFGDVLEAILGHLIRGVVNENVKPAQLLYRLPYSCSALIQEAHIALDNEAAPPTILQQLAGGLGIFIALVIHNRHVCPLHSEGDRPSNTRVATCDYGDFALAVFMQQILFIKAIMLAEQNARVFVQDVEAIAARFIVDLYRRRSIGGKFQSQ